MQSKDSAFQHALERSGGGGWLSVVDGKDDTLIKAETSGGREARLQQQEEHLRDSLSRFSGNGYERRGGDIERDRDGDVAK